jgi:hypothetical protein
MWSIKIGLVGDGYCYQIGDYVSARRYANSQSAWRDARRPQRIRPYGRIEPDIECEEITTTGVWVTSAGAVLRR